MVKAQQTIPDYFLEPAFTASFLIAYEQLKKIGYTNTFIQSRYGAYDIVQFNQEPLILTFICQQPCSVAVKDWVNLAQGMEPLVQALGQQTTL